MLKRNLVSNFLSQGWVALMGLVFVPLYIKYLGIEAYALIGIFAVIQSWMTLMDMGMTPTLTREMARFTAGAHSTQSIWNLLRSLEIICLSLAACIAAVVWGASDWLATDWLRAGNLPVSTASQAISIMAVVIALRFVEGIYRGSLFGLQKQEWFNVANAILASVRQAGVIVVLAWVEPTIQAFFIWQAMFSLATIIIFSMKVHGALPEPANMPKFSWIAISQVWQFASGMIGITFLAILLTQVDKLLLSRLLPLESFGYYTLAATIGGLLPMIAAPVTQAVYPRMVAFSTEGKEAQLVLIYHQSAQLVTILTTSLMLLLLAYPIEVVYMWSGQMELAVNAAPLLQILAFGTYLNVLMYVPACLQQAVGWTSLAIKTNVVAVIFLVPAILWATPKYGAIGAAWIWVVLNAGYVLVSIQFMHKEIMRGEKWVWYFKDILLPTLGAAGFIATLRALHSVSNQSRLELFAYFLICGCLMAVISILTAAKIRLKVYEMLRPYVHPIN